MIDTFYAHGKLLLTGEYFVLDGALALALPCKLGQSMAVQKIDTSDAVLKWKSLDHENQSWFEATFDLNNFKIIKGSDLQTASTLSQILLTARKQNSSFLNTSKAIKVETKLEFPRLWGLGSSSTLIYNIAQWSQANAFQILAKSMGGSGYDIACAGAEGPILYQNTEDGPKVERTIFNLPFRDQLYFVYLGKKQNSREGIKHYREKVELQPGLIDEISSLTKAVLNSNNLKDFETLMKDHEALVATALNLPRIQNQYFKDYPGVVKSLGAWGGDFVLATSDRDNAKTKEYFNEKGFDVFLKYNELIL